MPDESRVGRDSAGDEEPTENGGTTSVCVVGMLATILDDIRTLDSRETLVVDAGRTVPSELGCVNAVEVEVPGPFGKDFWLPVSADGAEKSAEVIDLSPIKEFVRIFQTLDNEFWALDLMEGGDQTVVETRTVVIC